MWRRTRKLPVKPDVSCTSPSVHAYENQPKTTKTRGLAAESTDTRNQAHEQAKSSQSPFYRKQVTSPGVRSIICCSLLMTPQWWQDSGLEMHSHELAACPQKNPCWLLLLAFIRLLKHFPLSAYSILIIRHPGTVWRSSLHPAVPTPSILSVLKIHVEPKTTPFRFSKVDKISQQSFSWKSQAHTEFCNSRRVWY